MHFSAANLGLFCSTPRSNVQRLRQKLSHFGRTFMQIWRSTKTSSTCRIQESYIPRAICKTWFSGNPFSCGKACKFLVDSMVAAGILLQTISSRRSTDVKYCYNLWRLPTRKSRHWKQNWHNWGSKYPLVKSQSVLMEKKVFNCTAKGDMWIGDWGKERRHFHLLKPSTLSTIELFLLPGQQNRLLKDVYSLDCVA